MGRNAEVRAKIGTTKKWLCAVCVCNSARGKEESWPGLPLSPHPRMSFGSPQLALITQPARQPRALAQPAKPGAVGDTAPASPQAPEADSLLSPSSP